MNKRNENEGVTLPINISLEKAKNELRYCLNNVCNKYNINNCLIGLLLESLLAEERQQQLTLMTEQAEQLISQIKEMEKDKAE